MDTSTLRKIFLLVALVCFVLGGLRAIAPYRLIKQAKEAASWTPVPAVIVTSKKEALGGKEEAWTVEYDYTVEEVAYTGTRYNVEDGVTGDYSRIERFMREYPAGAQLNVLVNPQDPTMAVLMPETGFRTKHLVMQAGGFIIGGLIFILIGLKIQA